MPPPRAVALLAALGLSCADEAEGVGGVDVQAGGHIERVPAPSSRVLRPPRPDGASITTRPSPPRILPHQITVYPEDELDPQDPTVLQVHAPPGAAAWVLAGAAALVEIIGGDPEDINTVVAAQRWMAAIARADAAVVATATDISGPIDPDSPLPNHDVDFEVNASICGTEPPSHWSSRLDPGSSCAGPFPVLDGTYLALLHDGGARIDIQRGQQLQPIVDGVIEQAPLPCTPAELAAACAAADEEVGP